jgi:hypothetical protein
MVLVLDTGAQKAQASIPRRVPLLEMRPRRTPQGAAAGCGLMFRLAITFVCGLGTGVALMDTLRPVQKPQFWLRYSTPVMTDYSRAEVERMYKDTLKARR